MLIRVQTERCVRIFPGGDSPGTHSECIAERAFEAYERMTDGGLKVDIDESTAGKPVDPWGFYRFCEPTPPGGLRLCPGWNNSAVR